MPVDCRPVRSGQGSAAGPGLSYTSDGRSRVRIEPEIDPTRVLNVQAGADAARVKASFREKTAVADRQKRAEVSLAYHMMREVGERYESPCECDAVDYAVIGHTEGLKRLIQADPAAVSRTRDSNGYSPLYLAARGGFYDTCEFLLQCEARPTACGRVSKSTPLHAAAYYGHHPLCTLLLMHGNNPELKNWCQNTALYEAKDTETKNKLLEADKDTIGELFRKLEAKRLLRRANITNLKWPPKDGEVVARVLQRGGGRHTVPPEWLNAWHGTKVRHIASIFEHGLKAAGSAAGGTEVKPPPGHYKLGDTHFGIENWAAAVFTSPSLLYAADPCYAESLLCGGEQWLVLVLAKCKPRSMTEHPSTVTRTDPVPGEPIQPEWRIPGHDGEDVIWRQGNAENLTVQSVVFTKKSFIKKIGSEQAGCPSFEEATKLLAQQDRE